MKYLMLVCVDPDVPDEEIPGAPDTEQWVKDNDAKGVRLMGSRVRPGSDATTVRVRDGQTLVTDGPFADTKEIFAGFYLIEADDLDQATELAARIPAVRIGGSVEIRPVVIERG